MFNKLQLHEQENSTNKKQQSIIVVYIGLFTRSDVDANLEMDIRNDRSLNFYNAQTSGQA
jgi:hypothetical protein